MDKEDMEYTHTDNGQLLSHEKEWNFDICNIMESIMLSEISQIEKEKYYMIPLMCGI